MDAKGETAATKAATYKQISEFDAEENKQLDKPKIINNAVEVDGAHEQMLPKEEKNVVIDSKVGIGEVKFTTNEKQNGEAQLDIGDVTNAFVGLTKEELMKYSNDPFWVRLRWILFVTFWLIWLAMLAGAIVIIIVAPKCSPPTPRTWWEQGPLTEVEVTASDEKLLEIKHNKFSGVIVSAQGNSYGSVNDSVELLDFLQRSKKIDLNVVVELNPLYSSEWFDKSESKEESFNDYYIWTNYKFLNGSDYPVEPNNWLSPLGGSSWKYSTNRKQFYYAPFSEPHLNFRNQLVVDEFSTVLKEWLDAGAAGIRLQGIPYLLIDETFQNESVNRDPGFVHTDYGFYSHSKTVNVEGIGEILAQWKTLIRQNSKNIGPLFLKEDLNSLDNYLVNDTLSIDLPRHTELFMKPDRLMLAADIYSSLNSAYALLGDYWPLWQINDLLPLSSDVVHILTMLLPGSPLVSSDVVIDPLLLKIREGASFMFGNCHRKLLANETVFAYTRVQAGNPGYLVACNPSDSMANVDFTVMRNVSDEVTIQVLSSNYSIPDMEPNLKIHANAVKMPAKSAIVLTYVPK